MTENENSDCIKRQRCFMPGKPTKKKIRNKHSFYEAQKRVKRPFKQREILYRTQENKLMTGTKVERVISESVTVLSDVENTWNHFCLQSLYCLRSIFHTGHIQHRS